MMLRHASSGRGGSGVLPLTTGCLGRLEAKRDSPGPGNVAQFL